MITKFSFSKLETSLYRKVWKVFRYLQTFRRYSQVWQTDGRTHRQTFS